MRYRRLNKEQIIELRKVMFADKNRDREASRARAIFLLDKGFPEKEIRDITQFSLKHVFTLRKNYFQHGINVVLDDRKSEPRNLLNKRQLSEIIDIVSNEYPIINDFNRKYWNTGIIAELIWRLFNINCTSKTANYLVYKETSFRYHKPTRKYCKSDPMEIEEWQKKIKSQISSILNSANSIVLCEDEMLLSIHKTIQTLTLKDRKNRAVIEVKHKAKDRYAYIYGFLDLKAGKEYAFRANSQSMKNTALILKRIRKALPNKHIFLLWENVRWHSGNKIRDFVKKDKQFQIMCFPKYATHENPQEKVWLHTQNSINKEISAKNFDTSVDAFIKYLNEDYSYVFKKKQ